MEQPIVSLTEYELLIEWPGKLIISIDGEGIGGAILVGDEFQPLSNGLQTIPMIKALLGGT